MPSKRTKREWKNGPTPRFVERYHRRVAFGVSKVTFLTGLGFVVKAEHGGAGCRDDVRSIDWKAASAGDDYGNQTQSEQARWNTAPKSLRKMLAPITWHNPYVSVMRSCPVDHNEYAKLSALGCGPLPPDIRPGLARRVKMLSAILSCCEIGDKHDWNIGFDKFKRPFLIDYAL